MFINQSDLFAPCLGLTRLCSPEDGTWFVDLQVTTSKVAPSTRNELVVAVHKVDVILMKLATDFAML